MGYDDEIEEGPRVLGIGLGLFLLILLWSFTLLAILVFTRVSSATGIFLTTSSALVSAIMLAIPRHPPVFKDRSEGAAPAPASEEEELAEDLIKVYDNIMIFKIIFMIIMGLFALGGLGAFISSHIMQQIYAQPIKKLKLT